MLFRKRPQPFTYHNPPKRSKVVVSHMSDEEIEALQPLPKAIASKRNADMVCNREAEGMRTPHYRKDCDLNLDTRKIFRERPDSWKDHRDSQYR